MENNNKDGVYKSLITLAILVPIILGLSYAFFTNGSQGSPSNVSGVADNFIINLVTPTNGYITASNVVLIKASEVATKAEKGTFSVVTGNNQNIVKYSLGLTSLSVSSNLQHVDFKWSLVCINDSTKSVAGTFAGASTAQMTLKEELLIPGNATDEYELFIWLEETSQDQLALMGGSFSGKVTLTAAMAYQGGPMSDPPEVTISGPYTTSGGMTPRVWAKAGDIGYYRIVVVSEETLTMDTTKITTTTANGSLGTITGTGTNPDPYVIPIIASSGQNGLVGLNLAAGAWYDTNDVKSPAKTSSTFTVDTQPPAITISPTSENVGLGDSYNVWSGTISVYDNLDTSVTYSSITTSGNVNTSLVGTYYIQYSATDAAGNTGSETRTVNVIDYRPQVAITGPFTAASGGSNLTFANSSTTAYYRIVVNSVNAFTIDTSKIITTNSTGTKGTITGAGTSVNPYIVPVTNISSANGTVGITVQAGAFVSQGYNNVAVNSNTFVVDNIAPTFVVTGPFTAASGGTTTNWSLPGDTVYYRIVVTETNSFSIDSAKITATNVNATRGTISGNGTSGTPYVVPMTGVTGANGTVGIVVAAGAFVDGAANSSSAANSATYTVSALRPLIGPLTNLVNNGSFELNASTCDNWANTGGNANNALSVQTSPVLFGSRACRGTGTWNNNSVANYGRFTQTISSLTNGNRYYIRANIYAQAGVTDGLIQNNQTNLTAASGSFAASGLGASWTTISGVWQSNATSLTLSVAFFGGNGNNAKTVFIDGIMMIDLTTAYGAGNEPIASEMNTVVASYGNYWDGSKP